MLVVHAHPHEIKSEYTHFTFFYLQMIYVLAEESVRPSNVCESLEICLPLSGYVGQPAVANGEHDSHHLNLLATIHQATKSRPERRQQYHDQQPGIHMDHTACTKATLNKRGAGAYSPLQGTASNQFQDDGPLKILQLTDVHVDIFYQEVLSDLLVLWYYVLSHFHF